MQKQLQMRIEAQGKYLQKIIEEQQKLSTMLSSSETLQLADDETKDSEKPSETPSTPDASARPPSPRKRQKLDDSSSGGISPPVPLVGDQKCTSLDQWDQGLLESSAVFSLGPEKEFTKQEHSKFRRR